MEQKINVTGTPNQKAAYACMGFAVDEARQILYTTKKTKEKFKAIDAMIRCTSEMTKMIATEIVMSKVTGSKVRAIESKDFEFTKITESHTILENRDINRIDHE